ncbi:MAG: hypothetical protein LUQ50_13010 [Methanospirillum sp.]|uniref:hypothetical protein n=1 Tax=Methanospirillum sp. TaxID=45200 RepID=UPI0023713605|nr:hypothetical protein [Methanospirillum sp.]MDD1729975.1 hypothetical protein [Methanospirillum sp.]
MTDHQVSPLPDPPLSRYQVNPFDFFSELLCGFSDQMIHLVIMLDGQLQYNTLVQAVMLATEAEPITRCRLVQLNDMLWWEKIPHIGGTDLVIRRCVSDPIHYLEHALSYQVDPFSGPLVQAVYLHHTKDQGDILVLNAHHTTMDGRGMKDFVNLILTLYRSLINSEEIHLSPSQINQRCLPRVSSLVPDLTSPPSGKVAWSGKFSVPLRSLDSERKKFSLLLMNRERVQTIQAVRKVWGVTMNDLLLAVVAQVCSSLMKPGDNRAISLLHTIDLRRYLTEVPVRSVLNYSTAFEVTVPVVPGESLEETTSRTHDLMTLIKTQHPGIDAVLEAERLYDAGCTSARKEMQEQWEGILAEGKRSPLYTNTGIISPENLDPGIPVSHAFLLPTHNHPPGFCFAISTFGEQITWSSCYSMPAFDPDYIRMMYTTLDQILPGYSSQPGTYLAI